MNESAHPDPGLTQWHAFISPFADILGKPVEEVTATLHQLIGEPGDQAIALLKDAAMTPDAAIKNAFQGTPLGIMNKAISLIRETQVPTVASVTIGADLLPDVPNDESLLASLKAGGVLKVEESTVISAVRTALASRVRLYEVPHILVKKMEDFADQNDEQADPLVFKARKDLLRRNYADVFEALDGMDGSFVTDARRSKLLGRVDQHLWPAVLQFHQQLSAWVNAWQQLGMSPMAMQQMMMRMSGMPATPIAALTQAPDTGPVRDAALTFNDSVNKVFSGFGVQIAAAMATEAMQIKKSLENPRLPALVGAPNRDQMLRMLDLNVSANYARLETNLTKYVLSIMKIDGKAAGNEEQEFLLTLNALGAQIPWSDLELGPRAQSREDLRRSAAR